MFFAKINGILYLCAIHSLGAPRRKGILMSDIETQALMLFRQLTPEQKLAFIRRVQPQPSQDQKVPPSDAQVTVPETSA